MKAKTFRYFNDLHNLISDSQFSKRYGEYIMYILFIPAVICVLFALSHFILMIPLLFIILHSVEQSYGLIRTIVMLILVYGSVALFVFLYSCFAEKIDEKYERVAISNIVFIIALGILMFGGVW